MEITPKLSELISEAGKEPLNPAEVLQIANIIKLAEAKGIYLTISLPEVYIINRIPPKYWPEHLREKLKDIVDFDEIEEED